MRLPSGSYELFNVIESLMATFPMTKRGTKLLKDKLHWLKTVERPAVIQSMAEARAQGDLSENADYDAAKEKQGFIEAHSSDLEAKLSAAQIIEPTSVEADGRVVFGATVDFENLNPEESKTYQFVGVAKANPNQDLISTTWRIEQALIGNM